ncbi:MAG: ABC transporter permease [Spirochaetaceae bacterium]|jgi:ribose transport system permease protein|nr:ABC transporter permease [Spirochaetaceae bacterium]
MAELQATATELKKKTWKDYLNTFGVILSLLLLCAFLTIVSPRFLTVGNLMNVAGQAAVNSIVSIGLFLAILTSGIDLSVGSVLALSTMFMGLFAKKFNMNPYLALLSCLMIGALLGLFNGFLLTKLHLPHPFISTMGTKQMARGLCLVVTATQPVYGFKRPIVFLGNESIGPVPVSFVLVAVLYVIMYLFLNRTKTGRYIYAVGGNKEAARLSGINVDGILNLVYAMSGFMAALAGIVLVGRVDTAYPLAGQDYETDAIAAVIIGGASFFGGVGKIGNTIVGVLLIAVLRNGLNLLGVTSAWQTFSIGAVIIIAVFVDVLRQSMSKRIK